MGKSPAKWIKTVLFGKKSSKSSSSKNVIIERRASTKESDNVPLPAAPDLPQVVDQGTETIELESPCDATSPVSVKGSPKFDDTEMLKLEQAATKAQSVFRGYLARRAFRALKGIIRLQALIRGHLVRRQAVATLHCMQSIVKLQALARGRKVRVLYPGHVVSGVMYAARMEVGSQKLTTNAFVMKLHSSLPNAMPLSLQYDPSEPNSARNWLERWSTMRFWEPPLPQQKRKPSLKAQSKRTVKRVSAETDKPRRNPRKITSHHSDSVIEQPQNELERVKRSLRKVSASSGLTSETPEIEIEKAHDNVPKESSPPAPDVSEQGPEDSSEKLPDPEIVEKPLVIEDPPKTTTVEEPIDVENGEKVEIEPSVDEEMSAKDHQVSKDNSQKTRRRKSLPTKQEYTENVSQDSPILPSYMAATKSAKAKLRAQGAPKVGEEGNGVENSYVRRHSLPSSTNGKKSSSPRVHRPLQANGKGGNKNIKPHASSKDDKTQSGWKR